MDLQNIGEFHCAVCFELFGENLKCPRVLTCGHSFCHSCLESLLVQSPTCPNCKQGIQFPNVASIPVNYIVNSLVPRFNANIPVSFNEQSNTELSACLKKEFKDELVDTLTLKKEISSHKFPYEGYCEDHDVYKHLRCMNCKCWVCGVCVALNHKPSRTLFVAEGLEEMKQEISQEVEAAIETQTTKNKNLDRYLSDLEGKRMSLKNEIKKLQFDLRSKIQSLMLLSKDIENLQSIKSNSKKHCEKVKLLEASVNETTYNNQSMKIKNKSNVGLILIEAQNVVEELALPKHLQCHFTQEILKVWCQEGSVYAFRLLNGSPQYEKVVVKGYRVWVHCFQVQPQRPNQKGIIIYFRELLMTFSGPSDLPRRGFIQVEDGTLILTDVVIATDALTPRAMNFLLLCSGIKGKSYEGQKFIEYEEWCIVTHPYQEGAVVKRIKDGGVYEAPIRKGFVGGFRCYFRVWRMVYWNSRITHPNPAGAVVKRIKDDGIYEAPVKKGFVWGFDFPLMYGGWCIGTHPIPTGAVVKATEDGGVYEVPCKKGFVGGFRCYFRVWRMAYWNSRITHPDLEGAVVKRIKDDGVYEAPVKKGFVWGFDFLLMYGGWCIGTHPIPARSVVKAIEDGGVYEVPCKKGFIGGFRCSSAWRKVSWLSRVTDSNPAGTFVKAIKNGGVYEALIKKEFLWGFDFSLLWRMVYWYSRVTYPHQAGALAKGIKDGGVYEVPIKKGFVWGSNFYHVWRMVCWNSPNHAGDFLRSSTNERICFW